MSFQASTGQDHHEHPRARHARVLDLRTGSQRVFAHILVSSLVVSVANFTIWFAVTFWTYLETRSVLATGLIAGIFLVATASTGIWFGSIVDHHRKQVVIQASAVASFVFYAVALGLYLAVPESDVARRGQPAAVGVRRGADARRDRGQPARHRAAHAGHPARPRAPA